jgi:hypothetical protein
MYDSVTDILTNSFVWLGTIAVWQQDIEIITRTLVAVSAITVSAVTVYYKIKRNGEDK